MIKIFIKKYIFNPQNKGYKIRISPALEKSEGFIMWPWQLGKKVGPPISIISFIDNDILIWLKDTKLNKYIPVVWYNSHTLKILMLNIF